MSNVIAKVQAFLENAKGSVKRFAKAVFPPELFAYIPGQKLLAGAVLYVAAHLAGLAGDDIVHVPVLDFDFTVDAAAAFIGFYLWPTNKPVRS